MRKYLTLIIFILCLIFASNCLFAADFTKEGARMLINFADSKYSLGQTLEPEKYNTGQLNDNKLNGIENISGFTEKYFPCAEIAAVNTGNEKMLDNPYEILSKYYEAIGGLDKVKAEKNIYCEGAYSTAGLNGTYKQWQEGGNCERSEVDLCVLKYSSGSNGQFIWQMDSNGKLHIEKNEKALKEKRLMNP